MKILVTGGAGFIGSNVVDGLINKVYKTFVVDNFSSGKRTFIPQEAEFYHLDIMDRDLDSIFKEVKPNVVIHLAAQIDVQKSMNHPLLDSEINILGTIKIPELCKKYNSKLVYSSSAAVYGNSIYLPIDEKHPINPLSNYGISKYTPEMYIKLYSQLYNLDFTILRYANVYGIRQEANREGGVVSIFIERMLNHTCPVIYGDGEQTRDFIYVEDVVSAILASLTLGSRGIYNISGNSLTSNNELVNKINILLNSNLKPQKKENRSGDIVHSCLNNQLAFNDLGWKPTYTLREGLRKTLDFFENQRTLGNEKVSGKSFHIH
jgi:UDP-glucose 4-epimerase